MMRINEWFDDLVRRDPRYAKALAEVEADERERIADEIVSLRVRAGLTQAEVAKLARTTQAVVSRLESAVGNPKLETINRVLNALRGHLAATSSMTVGMNFAAVEPGWVVFGAGGTAWTGVMTQVALTRYPEAFFSAYAAAQPTAPTAASLAANAEYAEAA